MTYTASSEREPLYEALTCISCGMPATARGLDRSHIIPRSQAPDRVSDPTNIVLQCRAEHDLIEAKKARHKLENGIYIFERWSNKECDFSVVCRVAVKVDERLGCLLPCESSPEPSQTHQDGREMALRSKVRAGDGGAGDKSKIGTEATDRRPAPTILSPAPPPSPAWTALALIDRTDPELAEEFHFYYGVSGISRLEAYRRIDAFRIKHQRADGEQAWVRAAEEVFDLDAKTLYGYARAWQAFEQQASQRSDFADALVEMGGGAWQVIGRAPRERWAEVVEVALSVVADHGTGRGLAGAVAARVTEEGFLPAPKAIWRCPQCGHEDRQGAFKVLTETE